MHLWRLRPVKWLTTLRWKSTSNFLRFTLTSLFVFDLLPFYYFLFFLYPRIYIHREKAINQNYVQILPIKLTNSIFSRGFFLSLPSFLPFSLFWTPSRWSLNVDYFCSSIRYSRYFLQLDHNKNMRLRPFGPASHGPHELRSFGTEIFWHQQFTRFLPLFPPFPLIVCLYVFSFQARWPSTQCSTTPWLAAWQRRLRRWEIGQSADPLCALVLYSWFSSFSIFRLRKMRNLKRFKIWRRLSHMQNRSKCIANISVHSIHLAYRIWEFIWQVSGTMLVL